MDYSVIKKMLVSEFQETNPTQEEMNLFYTGMVWFESAISDKAETESRLNDYVPEKLLNKYLYEELEGVKEIIQQNEKLKKLNQGLRNELENIRQLSQAEFKKLRMTEEYHRLMDELAYTKRQRDFWCEVATKLQYKENMSKKEEQQ